MPNKITYSVSEKPFTGKDANKVFKEYTLPNGTVMKILNRKYHEGALQAASSAKNAQVQTIISSEEVEEFAKKLNAQFKGVSDVS